MGGKGGREHADLHTPGGQIALDGPHVRIKAHGQHAVGLVKDQDLQILERQVALEQVVQDAPRRAHHQVSSLAKGLELGAIGHAAVDGGRAHSRRARQNLGLPGHLPGELARGHQDQGLAGSPRGVDALQHGQEIGAGLAAARARLDHQVAAGQQVGDGPALHRHQLGPAGPRHRLAQRLGQLRHGHLGQGAFRLDQAGARVLLSLSFGKGGLFHIVLHSPGVLQQVTDGRAPGSDRAKKRPDLQKSGYSSALTEPD